MSMENQSLVALTPADVAPAQRQLSDWCTQKMRALGREYRDLSANLRIAKKNRWSRGGLIKAVALTKRRIQYYLKMKRIVEAGYLIIPNLPIELIAVRVDRDNPRYKTARYPSHINEAKPELLPPDTGRYVDETLPHRTATRAQADAQGNVKRDSQGNALKESYAVVGDSGFREEIDFPLIAVKPIVMQATSDALHRFLFDQVGIATGGDYATVQSQRRRRSDPMVVGQIIDPRSTKYQRRVVSFFIAWWLNTEDL